MTAAGIDKQPIIKQHFDQIEDKAVVDTIGARMERVHDDGGKLYSHERYISLAHPLKVIAKTCADAYSPGHTHEQTWAAAQALLVHDILKLADEADDKVVGVDYDQLMIEEAMLAVFSMYTMDQQDGRTAPGDASAIDQLFTHRSEVVRRALFNTTEEAATDGLIAVDPDGRNDLAVADVINHRKHEVTQNSYAELMSVLTSPPPTTESPGYAAYEMGTKLYALQGALNTIKDSPVISSEQQAALIIAIGEATTRLDSPVAFKALAAIPNAYLHDLYAAAPDHLPKKAFEGLIDKAPEGIDHYLYAKQCLIQAIDQYFPRGIASQEARQYAGVEALSKQAGGYPGLILETLPISHKLDRRSSIPKEEIASHNEGTHIAIKRFCNEILREEQNPDAVPLYTMAMIDSLQPRKYTLDRQYFCSTKVKDTLQSLQSKVDTVGADEFLKLHDSFDLAAQDLMTHSDIATLIGLQDGDPAVIEKLKSQDVTLMPFDVYGDYNDSGKNIMTQLDNSPEQVGRIALPLTKVDDLSHMTDLLAKRGVGFCSLVFSMHGSPGFMSFNKGFRQVRIHSTPSRGPASTDGDDSFPEDIIHADVLQLRLPHIVRDSMIMPKFATELGMPDKKRIIYAVCSSDVGSNDTPSISESSIDQLPGRDTVVVGTENVTNINIGQSSLLPGLYMTGHPRGVTYDHIKDRHSDPDTSNMTILQRVPLPKSERTWIQVQTENHTVKRKRRTSVERDRLEQRLVV